MKKQTEDFYQAVYDLVRLVPTGRVSTYGAIAQALGAKGSARLVGYALNQVHHSQPEVPAHRIVNRNGLLSGHIHFGPGRMQALLEAEGIKVADNKVVDFESLVWQPLHELEL